MIQYCKFHYGSTGIFLQKTLLDKEDNVRRIAHNIFSDMNFGIAIESCSAEVHNNLMTYCSLFAAYAYNADSVVFTNNTVDHATSLAGIYDVGSSSFTATDNLLTYCAVGIQSDNPGGDIRRNAFHQVSGGQHGSEPIFLANNPYAQSSVGDFFLNSEVEEVNEELINGGSRTAQDAGLGDDVFTVLKPQPVAAGTHTGVETWGKIAGDIGDVAIGYHHNRIDRSLEGSVTFSGSSASLTINPGVVVAIGGQYTSLYIYTGAAFTCAGEPLGAGYNVVTNRRSASMRIESPQFGSSSSPYVHVWGGASDDLAVRFTKFVWLSYGIDAGRTIPGSIRDNIFALNTYGFMSEGCANTLHNNLFYRNWAGVCGWGDAMATNNTFDSNTSGIYYVRWSGKTLLATDNLFTGNDEGISLYWSGDPAHYNYNAYYGNSSNIYDYVVGGELDIGLQSRDLVSSPYDGEKPGWEARWYLKQEPDQGEVAQEVLAVDCGSQSSLMAGLDEQTTSVNLKPDIGIVDIGWHQPRDLSRDTDSDSMPDWWEDLYGYDPKDPGDADDDADEDSVYAYQEYLDGTSPRMRDSDHDNVPDGEDAHPGERKDEDGDGMTDDWETRYLGSTSAAPGGDPDGDGLSNRDEWNLDTDPTKADTDSDGIPDGQDRDPNGPRLTIVSLSPPKTASDDPAQAPSITSSPFICLKGAADARLRNVEVFVGDRDETHPGYAAIAEPREFEMTYVPLGGEGKYNIMVKAYDFDDNEAYAFTQVEVSYSAPPQEAHITVREEINTNRVVDVHADFTIPDGATPIAWYMNGQVAILEGNSMRLDDFALDRGANGIYAALTYSYGGTTYTIADSGTVYDHYESSPAYDREWYSKTVSTGQEDLWEEHFRDHVWFYDGKAHPDGYFYIETLEPPYGDYYFRRTKPDFYEELADSSLFDEKLALRYVETYEGTELSSILREVQSSLYPTEPVIGVSEYDYLVYVLDPSCFREEPLSEGYMVDGRQIVSARDGRYVVRMPLAPASGYWPSIQAPYRDYGDQKGYSFVCRVVSPKPYYIALSLQKSPDGLHWAEMNIGEPVIEGEWVDVVARYGPSWGRIEWSHSPEGGGWTEQSPPFEPEAGEHKITARYYAHPDQPERDLIGYVEDSVTFTVIEAPGIELISEVPKERLLVGERMPLFARVVKVNAQGEGECMSIEPRIRWDVWAVGGTQMAAKATHWRELWYQSPPPEPGHTEWWLVGTLAGVSEGKVKVQAVVWYYPEPGYDAVILKGPEHEIEVRGFVDLRLDNVGEWGEQHPGAFMAKGEIEELTLRTCTAGDAILSWNSDEIGLYTDFACEEQRRVVEDAGSVEGSRRAPFSPEYSTPPHEDRWDVKFRTEDLWLKALETSALPHDIHMALGPVSGNCASDPVNLMVIRLDLEAHRPGTMAAPGAPVGEAEEEEGVNLVAMVNDDNDDGGPVGQNDNRDTIIGVNDDDIVQVTLKRPMPSTLNTGVIHLAVAPVGSVQVLKSDGSGLLSDYAVNLAAPAGDLAGLATGPVNVFLEGMSAQANVVVRLSYANWDGAERASDMALLTALKVEAARIAFNHDWDSCTSDALNIRQNKTLTIAIPEYAKGVRNDPAAYVKDKSVNALVRFTAEPSSFVTSLKLRGVSDDTEGSLPDVIEKAISFEAGVSNEGTDDPATPGFNESEYAELQVSGKTPDKVFISNDSWNWIITEVNGVATPPLVADRSGEHRIYTLFDTPKSPWVINPHDDEKNPWSQVLSCACDWAKDAQNEDAAMASVTTGAYAGFAKTHSGGVTHTPGTTCHLTSLLSETYVDCRDMSAVVQLYTGILGGGTAEVRRVNGWFNYKPILPVRATTWTAGQWEFHQFGWKGNVYDACLKLKETDPRVPVNEDLNTTYKNDLFDSGTWSPQSSFNISNFD